MGGDLTQYSEKEINDGKAFAAIGYVGLCCLPGFLVPLLAAKDNNFAKFHGRQGAVLFVLAYAVAIVLMVIGFIASKIFAPIGCLFSVVQLGWGGAMLVMMVLGIVNALQGTGKELPLIGALGAKVPL